jgi:hypothetical protein
MEDREEREAMERALPGRSKASPYPMMLAVSEEEALQKARAVLSGALPG